MPGVQCLGPWILRVARLARLAARTDAPASRTTARRAVTVTVAALAVVGPSLSTFAFRMFGSSSAFWQAAGAIVNASASRTVAPAFQNDASRHPCPCTAGVCYRGDMATLRARPSHDPQGRPLSCDPTMKVPQSFLTAHPAVHNPVSRSSLATGLDITSHSSPVQSLPQPRYWPTAAASLQRCPTAPTRPRPLAVARRCHKTCPSIRLILYRNSARNVSLSRWAPVHAPQSAHRATKAPVLINTNACPR
jgi:hypothetical protein